MGLDRGQCGIGQGSMWDWIVVNVGLDTGQCPHWQNRHKATHGSSSMLDAPCF